MSGGKKGLLERLSDGEVVICAEGYLFELERRGYVQIGPFVPEVVLDNPDAVRQLHREFVNAGSDVVEAFTYYGQRNKMRLVGKEHLLDDLNRAALKIASEVAAESKAKPLVAGNLYNTTVYNEDDEASIQEVRDMFDEQCRFITESGVCDFVIGETFEYVREAILAVEAIKKTGLPSVITLAMLREGKSREGFEPVEALKMVKAAGADVVGLNCSRGPATMLPLLEKICKEVEGPIAALPVAYRTDAAHPTFQSLSNLDRKYSDLDPHTCTRYDFADFAEKAVKMGVKYIGVCCGGAPHHVRGMAEALGRHPPASAFSPDLSKHFVFGNKSGVGDQAKDHYLDFKDGM